MHLACAVPSRKKERSIPARTSILSMRGSLTFCAGASGILFSLHYVRCKASQSSQSIDHETDDRQCQVAGEDCKVRSYVSIGGLAALQNIQADRTDGEGGTLSVSLLHLFERSTFLLEGQRGRLGEQQLSVRGW